MVHTPNGHFPHELIITRGLRILELARGIQNHEKIFRYI